VVVFGYYEVLVAGDGGGEVFVVVGSGGGDGEVGSNEGGLIWWGPREVSGFGPDVKDGG